MTAPNRGEAARLWAKIGLLSFGGPAGQIALMREELVTRRAWVSPESFERGLSVAMLLPGPEAQQLATWLGWRVQGWRGGLLAGLAFILPGALLMIVLAALAACQSQTSWVNALFYGIQPAVLVLVLKAVFGLAQRAATGVASWMLAAAAFGALTFTSAPFPLVIAAAGALGFALFPRVSEDASATSGRWTQSLRVLGFGALLIACSLLVVRAVLPDVFGDIARLFTTAAFVSFGGAYALLPFVAENAVEREGWLTAAEMLNGLALGEATPGPLILVNLYAGFFGGWSDSGVWAGVLGAVLACYFTFLPSFVLVFAIAPHVESLGRVPWARAALAGVS
ncbi:MAG: chromate efflux transporter, partial [Pseudomonadota bacterium]